MSKIISFVLAGAGATATAVGGTYLIRGTSGSAEPKLEFESVSKFESGFNSSKCVRDLFKTDVEKPGTITDISASAPDANSFFKNPSTSEEPTSGCLKIEHQIIKYKDNKWAGKFTWTWTFIRGDEGFINFNVAETDDKDEGKLKFSGIFYLVSKKTGGDNKWEIKYKKSVGENKKASKDDLDTYFPQVSDDLKATHKDYWEFVDDKNKLGQMCKDETCRKEPAKPSIVKRELSWTKGNGASKKLSSWSKDMNWWKNLYGDTPWSLDSKTTEFKGTWKSAS